MSTNARIYLDYVSATPILPEVAAAMTVAFDEAGNPSSIHQVGRRAQQALHQLEAQILDEHLMGALEDLRSVPTSELVETRYQKFRRMGTFGQAKFF